MLEKLAEFRYQKGTLCSRLDAERFFDSKQLPMKLKNLLLIFNACVLFPHNSPHEESDY